MGSYYYLAAQLPYLVYGQPVPMTAAAFKRLAWEGMSAGDRAALDFVGLDPALPDEKAAAPGLPEFVSRWREWEGVLRLNLAKNRAAKLKRDFSAEVPDFPSDAAAAAKGAFAME